MNQTNVLEQILSEAAKARLDGRKFLAVFDLDSTLLDLTLRVTSICEEFARTHSGKYPNECQNMGRLKILKTDWGINEGLERIGMSEDQAPDFWREVHEHWALKFFSNDFLHHDEPLPGAVEFVNELQKVGADIMYLTGRDVPRMYDGTKMSLEAQGFPVHPTHAKLVLKPDAKLDDAHFKVGVLKEAAQTYSRIWLFENEPVNTNLVARECPEVGIVFIESTHSGREEAAADVARIAHFDLWTRKMKA